ncbi:MAG: TonB-dependent receptor [bacterium]
MRGKVADADGEAVYSAVVRAAGRVDVTDSRGEFVFENIPPGEYEFTVNHVSFKPEKLALCVEPGSEPFLMIRLTPSAFTADEITIISERNRGAIILDGELPMGEAVSVIKELPGVMVIEGGTETSVSIRGSRPRDVLILIDGVPLERNENGVCDLNALPSGNIESIEVLTGEISAEYASRAPAGIISITTSNQDNSEARLIFATGSFGHLRAAAAAAFALSQKTHLEISGGHGSSERDFEYSAGDTTAPRINNSESATSAGISLSHSIPNLSLRTSFSASSREDGMPGDLNHPTPLAFKRGEYYRSNTTVDAKISHWSLKARLSLYRSWNYAFSPRPYVFAPIDGSQRVEGISLNASASRPIGFFLARAGAEYFAESYAMQNNLNSSRNIGPESRSLSSVWMETPMTVHFLNYFKADFTPSVRWDFDGEDFNGLNSALHSEISASMGDFSGGVSASYSEAFRLAAFSDLYWQRDAFAEGNPELQPEMSAKRSLRLHMACSADWADVFIATDFFWRDIDSVIIWRRGYDGVYRPYNSGGEATIGREDYIKLDLFDFLSLTWSNTTQEAIHLSTNPQLDGKWLPYRPNYLSKFTAELTYGKASIRGDYTAVGKRYLLEANTKWTEPYGLFDISADYAPSIAGFKLKAEIGIRNILDESYEIISGYPMPGRSYYGRLNIERKLKGRK